MTRRTMRVLIVEDDDDYRDTLRRYLVRNDIQADGVASAERIDRHLDEAGADIVVLDIGLPGESGMAAAARLRGRGGLGIVLLTARGAVDDRVLGLSLGADAYLVKPVDPRELVATLASLFRRLSATPSAPPGGWHFDSDGWRLVAPDGAVIPLSGTEWRIVSRLVAARGTPVPREAILATLGKADSIEDRSIDTLLCRLRRRVREASGHDLPIRSARGLGYVFTVAK